MFWKYSKVNKSLQGFPLLREHPHVCCTNLVTMLSSATSISLGSVEVHVFVSIKIGLSPHLYYIPLVCRESAVESSLRLITKCVFLCDEYLFLAQV